MAPLWMNRDQPAINAVLQRLNEIFTFVLLLFVFLSLKKKN